MAPTEDTASKRRMEGPVVDGLMFPLILSFGADPFHCLFTRLFLLSVQLIGSADGSFSACQGEHVAIYRKCIGAIPCGFI